MIRATALTGAPELLEAAGVSARAILAEAGLTPELIGDPEVKIPLAAVARVLGAAERAGIPDFGLWLAADRTLQNWGILGVIARTQPTLRQIVYKLAAFLPMQVEGLRLRLSEGPDSSQIQANWLHQPAPEATRQVVEMSVAVLHRSLNEATGGHWRPAMVCFRHTRPASLLTHVKVFGGAPLAFDEDFDGFVLDTRDLNVVAPGSDPIAAGSAEGVARREVKPPTLAERVTELLFLRLGDGICGREEIAENLGLSVRTFQRRLAKEGVTFAAVLESARIEMARIFVEASTRPLSEAALQLGFQSQSAFTHWFGERFGESPSARRRAARLASLRLAPDLRLPA